MKNNITFFFLAFIFTCPVFFIVSPSKGFKLAPSYSSELTGVLLVPVSYLVSPFLLFTSVIAYRGFFFSASAALLGAGILGCYTISIITGLILEVPNCGDARSFQRYLQSCIPVVSFFLGMQIIGHEKTLKAQSKKINAFIIFASYLIIGYFLLYFIQTLIGGQGNRFSVVADHIGPFYNPKIKRFYPSFLAIALVVLLALFFQRSNKYNNKYTLLAASILGLLGLLTFWSRTAIFTLVCGFSYVSINMRFLKILSIWIVPVAALLFLYLFNFSEVLINSFTGVERSYHTLLVLFGDSQSSNPGDIVRFDRIWFAVSESLRTPFGSGFSLHKQYLFPVPDIAIAENGYLDVSVRGGVPALTLLVFILISAYRRVKYAEIKLGTDMLPTRALFFSLVFGVLPWLHMTTEAYFSSFFWLLIGMLCGITNTTNCISKNRCDA